MIRGDSHAAAYGKNRARRYAVAAPPADEASVALTDIVMLGHNVAKETARLRAYVTTSRARDR
jgi:hypothetical protein